MPIFAMKRAYKNGNICKKPIVFFDAIDEKEAFKAFGVGKYWRGYKEDVSFCAEEVERIETANVILASQFIREKEEDEKFL